MAPFAEILYACDRRWWQTHIDEVRESFKGELWTQDKVWNKGEAEAMGLNVIESISKPGLSTTPGVIHQGENSGYQAINMALLRGAEQVFLLGYDMCAGTKTHFFGDHPKALGPHRDYEKFIKNYKTISEIEIINLSRRTALHFPRANLDQVCNIRNRAKP